jgi:hypothetical protein
MHGEAERWAESSPRGVASPPAASPQPLAKRAPTPSVPERRSSWPEISATAQLDHTHRCRAVRGLSKSRVGIARFS